MGTWMLVLMVTYRLLGNTSYGEKTIEQSYISVLKDRIS